MGYLQKKKIFDLLKFTDEMVSIELADISIKQASIWIS